MRHTSLLPFLIVAPLAALVACDDGGATTSADPAGASFGIGKADEAQNGYTACQLREVLEVVNESTSTPEALQSAGKLDPRAAKGIVAHRLGPDGVAGTGDDDLFDDLAELDAIEYVGPKSLDNLVAFIAERCLYDLATRPYIDDQTFKGTTGGGWTRNEVEIEATYAVTGITGRKLREILTKRDSRDRTIYSRLRKNEVMAAFTIDYPIDEIPWNRESHEARRAMPLMAWSVEWGRFEQPAEGGPRELSLGTDPNDDTYYDTHDFTLIDNGMTLRGRVRFDDADTIRRILIQAKLDSAVDPETGLKKAGKTDVRDDSADHVGTLDADVKRGKVAWNGSDTPVEPIRVIWQSLVDKGLLPDVDGKKQVLVLDPKARLRSVRSRFHLNFAKTEAMQRIWDNGIAKVRRVHDDAVAGKAAQRYAQGDIAAIDGLIARAAAILDSSAILEAARADLSALDQALTDVVYPGAFLSGGKPASWVALEKRRVVAEAAERVLVAFAEELDEVDDILTGTDGVADASAWVEPYVLWQQSTSKELQKIRTAEPFLTIKTAAATPDDDARALADFNGYGQAQRQAGNGDFRRFEAIDADRWAELHRFLLDEAIDDWERMITEAGTMARALWFELARQYYVPQSWRSYGNFIIDTFDWTDMVSEEEWQRIPDDQKKPGAHLPADHVFHTTLVNEVQLELTEVSAYVERIEALTAQHEQAPDDAELERNLDGAKWVFDELQRSTRAIAELKGDAILERLEDEGGPDGMGWGPATHAKGNTALLILTDKL
ncbi:MAG: hypothetical protein IT385_23720 [Deltaproteobacteria bacterium]|nr:hypothetical protein [Deltaproteobacteria bacterium]